MDKKNNLILFYLLINLDVFAKSIKKYTDILQPHIKRLDIK
jgi:hypothetical protein